MTDEIKMCKKSEKDDYKVVGGVDLNEYYWEPLDPQPCCENCINQVKDICTRLEIVAYDDFFCSNWEPKVKE
jgi:hypothetical protein